MSYKGRRVDKSKNTEYANSKSDESGSIGIMEKYYHWKTLGVFCKYSTNDSKI